jgi:hypothetical protein
VRKLAWLDSNGLYSSTPKGWYEIEKAKRIRPMWRVYLTPWGGRRSEICETESIAMAKYLASLHLNNLELNFDSSYEIRNMLP